MCNSGVRKSLKKSNSYEYKKRKLQHSFIPGPWTRIYSKKLEFIKFLSPDIRLWVLFLHPITFHPDDPDRIFHSPSYCVGVANLLYNVSFLSLSRNFLVSGIKAKSADSNTLTKQQKESSIRIIVVEPEKRLTHNSDLKVWRMRRRRKKRKVKSKQAKYARTSVKIARSKRGSN